ncbi:MAG: glycosyltransferase family 4 protein [Anaerolineae bacterium]|nr:glycosyltransferase family 4 protein [Anaerolineae bacterium]
MKSDTLRTAMIIQAYHPHIGGAERQLAALAPLLHNQGVDVQVLTRRYPGLAPFEQIDGVPVHRLPIPGPKPMASFSFTMTALPLLRQLKPDVIHAHELLSPTTTAVTAKRLFRVPVVAKVLRGGVLGDVAKLKSKPLGSNRISSFRKHVDAFITISHEIDEELAELGIGQERRPFIPNGVDTERFKPLPSAARKVLRQNLSLPDVPIVIFTGRLAAEKRVDQLVALWPEVRAVQPDALLLVLGTGEEETALKKAAGDGVRFEGRVDDVVPYLQAADLFVLPSATEGLSNALLEALSSGMATVATKVGGAPDVIDHQRSGWLVPPDQPAALQEAIITLLSQPDCRTELGRRGRDYIVSKYALPVIAERLRTLYERVSAN